MRYNILGPLMRVPATVVVALLGVGLIVSSVIVSNIPFFEKIPFLEKSLHEVGFAIVVAVVIWIVFERLSSAQTEEQWNQRLDRISKDVFHGVLGRNLPQDLIKTAFDLVLTQNFIRSDLTIEYELKTDSIVDSNGRVPSVELTIILSYGVENIHDKPMPFPIRILLPNPVAAGLKEKTQVKRVTIGKDGTRKTQDIARASQDLKDKIRASKESQVVFSLEEIIIPSKQTIEVEIEYVLGKEQDDDEIFLTSYASDSIRLRIRDAHPADRIIRARPIHPEKFERRREESGNYEYHLPHFLLPCHGTVIGWSRTGSARTQIDSHTEKPPQVAAQSSPHPPYGKSV